MRFGGLFAALMLAAPGAAYGEWRVAPAEITAEALPPEAGAPAAAVTADGLPDGRVTSSTGDIARAWYQAPTDRYAHAILGDGIEAGALVLEGADGARARLRLPNHQVFEDRTPRIADLDGDGRAEVITIRSSRDGGAGVAVYALRDGVIEEIAAVPEIGTPNRWLNIAALADLTGDGRLEIAFVRTPHIGGTLRVFAFDGADLTLIDEAWGFSNHAIGAREMRLSAVLTLAGVPHLGLPSADRRAFRIATLRDGRLEDVATLPMPRRIAGPVMADEAGFIVPLSGGRILRIEKGE